METVKVHVRSTYETRQREYIHHVDILDFDGRQKSEGTHRRAGHSPCSDEYLVMHNKIPSVENRPECRSHKANSINGTVKV